MVLFQIIQHSRIHPHLKCDFTNCFFRLCNLCDHLLLLDLWPVRHLLRITCENRMERGRTTKGTKSQQGCQRLYESRLHLRNCSHRDLTVSENSCYCSERQPKLNSSRIIILNSETSCSYSLIMDSTLNWNVIIAQSS